MDYFTFSLSCICIAWFTYHTHADYIVGNIRCYTCREEADNEACNMYTTPCPSYTHACETQVDNPPGSQVLVINKRCVNIDYCYAEGSTVCNQGRCSYCCSHDLCNAQLNYGTSSKTCPPLKGVPGTRGEPGPMGLPGRPGVAGYPGIPGQPGKSDVPGLQGINGDAGQSGVPGRPGDPGLPGLQGPPGQPGVVVTGKMGHRGLPGLIGLDGQKGEPGPKGARGPKGFHGNQAPCNCPGSRSTVQPVGFSGTATDVKRSDAEEYAPVVLTQLSLNEGNFYDNVSSTFVAPFDGVYMFSFTSSANGIGAAPLVLFRNEVFLGQSGRSSLGATGPYPMGANQLYTTLNRLDEVKLKVKHSGETLFSGILQQFSSQSDVTFAGHLVSGL